MPNSQPQRIGLRNAVLTLLMSAALWLALFGVASAEVIRSFVADYEVSDNGFVTVTEIITYDFEGVQRHGIYRNIKNKHPQPASAWYKERHIDINLLSVTRDGQPEPYKLESYDGLSVRIGDANKTIAGIHAYKIVYTLEGAMANYPEGTEFYWNVTGNEWGVPINNLFVKVFTKQSDQLLPRQACYVGTSGSIASCDGYETNQNFGIFKQARLMPGQELTIAQAVNLLNPPVVLESINYFPIVLLGVIAWLVILGFWIYRWRNEYKPDQTIIPQYEPYQDFKPMFTGVLIDNKLDPRDISAGIVYLAQQGFISIKQTTDKILWLFDATDYEVTLLRSPSEVETKFQSKILELIFGGVTNVGVTKRLSDIRNSASTRRRNAAAVQVLKQDVVKDMIERGFLEQRIKRVWVFMLIFVCIWLSFFINGVIVSLFGSTGVVAEFIFFGSCIIYLLFALERRTRKGFEALNHLKGFKDFLSTTEKERYKFHNAPSLSPQQFMEYLPYAIAFGVEKEWAEVFKDIQIDAPDWYGSSTGTSFDTVAFTSGIGAFSTAFASSTGSSGSSGGGSAGGGGGGGGGGSW